MSQQPKAKMNIPMCAACVLLCLTLFSIHLTSGLYAKYIAKGNGSDEARVAKFEVVASDGVADVFIDVTSVDNESYEFVVRNNSEVAVKYDVVLTFNRDVPNYLKIQLDGKSGTIAGNVVSFANVGSQPSNNSDGVTHSLKFTVSSDKVSDLLQNATGNSAEEKFSFNAVIKCEQID